MTGLPQSWAECRLADIVEVNPSLDRCPYPQDGTVHFVPMGAVEAESGLIDVSTQRLYSEVKKGYTAFVPGDVLFAKITPCMENGKMAVVPDLPNAVGCGSTEFHVLRAKEGISPDYIYYFVSSKSFRFEAEHKMTGAVGQKRVPTSFVAEHPLPLPPIPEQHRIVARIEELFSELDASVESLTKARALLGLFRQSLLRAAFQGKLSADWRAVNPDKLEPPETLLSRIRKEREARYAKALEDWQTALSEWRNKGEKGRKPARPTPPAKMDAVRLEPKEIAGGWMTLPLGWFIDEPAYGTAKKCSYESAGLGVLRIPNISDGSIDPADLKFADFDDDEIEAYRLEAGDILIIRSNGSISIVGKAAVVTKAHEQLLFAGYLIRLRPIMSLLNSRFLLRVLESHDLRKQIEEMAKSTSGVNNISAAEIKGLMVPVCSIGEQVEVDRILEEKLSVIDQSLMEIITALIRIAALRQSILKRAFSGRLVPQDPNDEPAPALLARLQSQTPTTPIGRRGRA